MTNIEKWFTAMELLHEIKVAPLNPDFSQEKYDNARLHEKVMIKVRRYLDSIPSAIIPEEDKDMIEDRMMIVSCSVLELYSYHLNEGGYPRHSTSRGNDLIRRTGLLQERIPAHKMRQFLERIANS